MQLQELTTYEDKSHLKIVRVHFVIADQKLTSRLRARLARGSLGCLTPNAASLSFDRKGRGLAPWPRVCALVEKKGHESRRHPEVQGSRREDGQAR